MQRLKPIHIALCGNIGAGKSTVADLLGKYLGFSVYFEVDPQNPFLEDFYRDMERWAFPMQMYLLDRRVAVTLEIQKSQKNYIQDRTLYEDAEVFACVLREMKILPQREYEVYHRLYEKIASLISPPDLLVYLRAGIPKLVENILDRGRPYEENINLEYLRRLNEAYESWFARYDWGPKVAIGVDELDFRARKEDIGRVLDEVMRNLYNLFR